PTGAADQFDASAVIVDVQPVTDVHAIAVQRHGTAVEQVGDEQRDDLLRKLVRPVVVGASGDRHRNTVGAVVGQRDQVTAGLAGAIGRVRREQVVLGPRTGLDGSVDLVGGDVHEP